MFGAACRVHVFCWGGLLVLRVGVVFCFFMYVLGVPFGGVFAVVA